MRPALTAIAAAKARHRDSHPGHGPQLPDQFAFITIGQTKDIQHPARVFSPGGQMIDMPTDGFLCTKMPSNPGRQPARPPGTTAIDVQARSKGRTLQPRYGQCQRSGKLYQQGIGTKRSWKIK